MSRTDELRQWLVLAAALLILGSVIAYKQYQDHLRIGLQEQERLAALADVVGKNIAPQIVLADRIISNIINALPAWQAENDGFKLANRELKIVNDTINGIPPLLVMDAAGTVIVSSEPGLLGQNFAYRDYFKAAVKNPDPRILQVGAPFKTVLNDFAFTLLRTIKGPQGEFAGIVVVTEVPAYFTNLLDSVRYVPDVRTAIVHGDGKIFLSSPRAEVEGEDLSMPGSLFMRHLQSGKPASVFTGSTLSSGDDRIMAQHTIQLTSPAMDKALVVAVSRDVQSIYSSWGKEAYVQDGLFGMLVLSTVLGLRFYQRRQQVYRQAETARRASEEQLASFYELDLVGLAITSPEKGWVRINNCLCNMLGYSEQELRSMTWAELTHPDDLAADVEQFNRMLFNEIGGYSLEKRFVSRTGKIVPTKLVVGCIRDENGRVQYVVAMVEDIFERKEAEDKVSELNRTLERRVAERTAQLEAANKELEAFSYSVSHDLRAPLRAIDGFSRILLEDYSSKLDEEGQHELEVIRRNATRMGELIDDILDFSRTSRQAIATVPIDMAVMAKEVFDEVCSAVPDRRIRLCLGDFPPARGDQAMIHQVLVNLLSNAVKFTAVRSEAIIEIDGSSADGENTYRIRDNGAGFDMQYVNKLFGVFQRLHKASEFEGTGIGLAIVKRIIERHGGRVWAEGSADEGATFSFVLPT